MRAERFLIIAILIVFIAGLSPVSALALPKDPLDPDRLPELPEPEFTPPAGGFDWSTPSRFGQRNALGIIDYHWDPVTATYDQEYLNPSGFRIDFDGCPTEEEAAATTTENTYTWEVAGTDVTSTGNTCRWAHVFPAQGEYDVKLTVTDPEGAVASFEQTIEVKDLFIVSIGDSYGSGEGTPDIPQQFDELGFVKSGAKWVDERCHRSALAGSAQAALTIERADPKTSVTFISLACSGATINTPINPGPQSEGTGVLGPYRGTVPLNKDDFSPAAFLESQVQALAKAANGREIDALIVSGGGNDLHFANILADCVWHNMPRVFGVGGRCHEQPEVLERLANDLATLPGRYDALAAALHDPAPAGRPPLNIRNVYLTEYPDSTRDSNGETCGSILGEILPTTPFDFAKVHIDRDEANWARQEVILPLNANIKAAAERHADKGWHFVTGISEQYVTHGYCADDPWIVRVYDSARQQGPLWVTSTSWGPLSLLELQAQTGTMHPNAAGQRAYARQIVKALLAAEGPGPGFSTATASGSSTAMLGASGWLVGSCEGSTCSSDRVVFEVVAEDPAGIRAAALTVNGSDCASLPGITCSATLDGANRYRWTFEITLDGVYRLDLVASNQSGASSSFTHEVKVDLHDPLPPTASIASGTEGTNGWYRSVVDVVLDGSDAAGGSGVALIEYQSPLLGDGVYTTGPGATVPLGADMPDENGDLKPAPDGEYVIQYRTIDQAGRTSTFQSLTVRIDRAAPELSCGEPDGLWHAQDVSITCTAGDDTSGLADGSDASFELHTSVAEGTETADAATDSRHVCDVAGNCQQAGPVAGNMVDRKAPEIVLTSPATGPYLLNDSVVASYECIDGGSGVALCHGNVPDGSDLDTSSVGTRSFTVDAQDNVANASSEMLSYDVTYAIHPLFDQAKVHKANSTIPIKLQIHDARGANMSESSIVVSAVMLTSLDGSVSTTEIASSANKDTEFRYDSKLRGYIYNFSTKGLSPGTWALTITVSGDPVPHTITFKLR